MLELFSTINDLLTVTPPDGRAISHAFGFLAALPMIGSALGSIFGGAGKGASDSRMQQNQLQAQKDQTEVSKYGIGQNAQMQLGNLDLNRKQFEDDARGKRAKQALIGSLLQNYQPSQVSVPGIKNATVSGGLAASLQNPGAQASMQELLKQALAAQMAQGSDGGEQFSGGAILPTPGVSSLPKAGKLESILGGVGLGGSLLSSVLANIKKDSGGA